MSAFGNSLLFLARLGFFDVILPFLLIFTLLYAVLDRTNILGYFTKTETVRKKNLNAIVAFSIAFLVISSAKAVSFLVSFIPKVMIIFIIISLLVILAASLYGYSGEDQFKIDPKYRKWFLIAVFVSVGVILFMVIDFNEILSNPNINFLRLLFGRISIDWEDVFYGILMLALTLGAIWLVVREPTTGSKKEQESQKK
ncbi:MAG: hypothetical protein QW524_00265 [Candidatus Woesearchaeota archaeon]